MEKEQRGQAAGDCGNNPQRPQARQLWGGVRAADISGGVDARAHARQPGPEREAGRLRWVTGGINQGPKSGK